MSTIVTGVIGCILSDIVKKIAWSHDVVFTDIVSSGKPENLKECSDSINGIQGRFSDLSLLKDLFNRYSSKRQDNLEIRITAAGFFPLSALTILSEERD
jgi:UDP-glucose 4-epimerase